jgi:hypothetical protein
LISENLAQAALVLFRVSGAQTKLSFNKQLQTQRPFIRALQEGLRSLKIVGKIEF